MTTKTLLLSLTCTLALSACTQPQPLPTAKLCKDAHPLIATHRLCTPGKTMSQLAEDLDREEVEARNRPRPAYVPHGKLMDYSEWDKPVPSTP
jgi:hypothetical protein